MKHFHFLLFVIGFFSFAQEDSPLLDVPESTTDTAVDIQVVSPPAEQKPPSISDQTPSAELEEAKELQATEVQEDPLVQEAVQAESEEIEQVEAAGAESEEVEQVEAVQQQVGESEEVKALKLKIKAYTPDYKYTIEDKKDPFSKPGALKDLTTVPEERLHPIEQDSIDNIKLKAIIWGRDGVIPRALFEIQNKTYTLTENDRIGQEGALIARIDMDRVWTMKPVTDPSTGLVKFEPYEKTLKTVSTSAAGTELFYER